MVQCKTRSSYCGTGCTAEGTVHIKSKELMSEQDLRTEKDGECNHRMNWVGRDIIDHLVPTPLPWAGTTSTRSGYSKPHPTWS